MILGKLLTGEEERVRRNWKSEVRKKENGGVVETKRHDATRASTTLRDLPRLETSAPFGSNETSPSPSRKAKEASRHTASITNLWLPAVKESQSRCTRVPLPSVSVLLEITCETEGIIVADGVL